MLSSEKKKERKLLSSSLRYIMTMVKLVEREREKEEKATLDSSSSPLRPRNEPCGARVVVCNEWPKRKASLIRALSLSLSLSLSLPFARLNRRWRSHRQQLDPEAKLAKA
jgi:hypothetical protein